MSAGSNEKDETGAYLNHAPCEKCADTRRYHRVVLDPQRARRFLVEECTKCGHQQWSELPDK
jgi:uncharacterized Zn finger protein